MQCKKKDVNGSSNMCEKQSYFTQEYNIYHKHIFFCLFAYSEKGERYNKKNCFMYI